MNTASHELARTLLRKAEIDLLNATVLRNSSQRNREGVGLHVQQAVEKSLKAILAFHQIHYPKTHVISGLVRLASDNDIELPDTFRESDRYQIAIRFMRWVSGMTNLALTKNLTLMRQ
jgi:HEPN domain-containing protein